MANALFSPATLAVLGIILMSALVINAPRQQQNTAESIFEAALNQYHPAADSVK